MDYAVFKGGILGSMHHFWGDPYLNSSTVLFDTLVIIIIVLLLATLVNNDLAAQIIVKTGH